MASLGQAKEQVQKGTRKAIGYLQPYAETGQGANKLLADALGINGPEAQAAYYSGFQNDPGYMATRDAGIAGIDQNRVTSGLLHSGGTLKALQDYGMRLMQSQFMDRLQRLSGMQGQGLTAATSQGGYRMTGSHDIADYLAQIGGARASGIVGAANAKTAGSTGLFNAGINLLSGGLSAGLGGLPGGARNYLSAATGGSGGWQTSITPQPYDSL